MADDLNNVSDVSYGTTTRLKIIFMGNIAVGKTSMIKNLLGQKFQDEYESSVGVDFFSLSKKFKGKLIKIQMWDTAGQEKYRSLIPNYVRGASLIFLCYDITDRQSFEDLTPWINFINEYEHTQIAIIGNKIDLDSKRKVTVEEGEKFASDKNFDFFEVSAKTNPCLLNVLYSAIASLPAIQSINPDRTNKDEIVNDFMAENEDGSSLGGSKIQGQGFESNSKRIEQTNPNENSHIDISNPADKKKNGCAC